jgi:plasmid stabilization system protein ParE
VKRLELSVDADADLFDTLAYGTAVHGEAVSDAYYFGLMDCFDFSCANPGAGQIDEDSGLGLRRWRYRQHRIFYRVGLDQLLVVRVFHVSADAVQWLKDQQ